MQDVTKTQKNPHNHQKKGNIFVTIGEKTNHTEPQTGNEQQKSISKINFRAINVNGLGDRKKRRLVLEKLREQNQDFPLLN